MMFVVLGTFFHQLNGKLTISKVKFKFKLKYCLKKLNKTVLVHIKRNTFSSCL